MASSLLLLPSAARTADAASASSENFLGISTSTAALMLIVDLTASGGAISLTPKLQVKEPSGGSWIDYWTAAAAIVAVGQSIYMFAQRSELLNGASFPSPAGKLIEFLARPINGAEWRVLISHGNANSQTYSVGAYWIFTL